MRTLKLMTTIVTALTAINLTAVQAEEGPLFSPCPLPRTSPAVRAGALRLALGLNTKPPTLVRTNMDLNWIRPWPSNGETETTSSRGKDWSCHGRPARRSDGTSRSIWV